jgi:hypothetical protein
MGTEVPPPSMEGRPPKLNNSVSVRCTLSTTYPTEYKHKQNTEQKEERNRKHGAKCTAKSVKRRVKSPTVEVPLNKTRYGTSVSLQEMTLVEVSKGDAVKRSNFKVRRPHHDFTARA